MTEVCGDAERVRKLLVNEEAAGRVRLDDALRTAPIDEVIDDAVRTFGMYHLRSAVEHASDALIVRDPKMLYFYGNRLSSWATDLREGLV